MHSERFLPDYLTGYEFVKFLCEVPPHNDILNIQDYFDMVACLFVYFSIIDMITLVVNATFTLGCIFIVMPAIVFG